MTAAICGAKTRNGTPCARVAGWGTASKFGRCSWHGGATRNGQIAAAKAEARAQAALLGAEVELDPADALGLSVRLAAGEVEFLRGRITERRADDPDADLDALGSALATANERLARVSKLASDAGVAERSLELDEAVVLRLAEAVRAALVEAELTPEQEVRAREALTRRLADLDGLDWRRGTTGAITTGGAS